MLLLSFPIVRSTSPDVKIRIDKQLVGYLRCTSESGIVVEQSVSEEITSVSLNAEKWKIEHIINGNVNDTLDIHLRQSSRGAPDVYAHTPGNVPYSFSGKVYNISTYIKAAGYLGIDGNEDADVIYPDFVRIDGKVMTLTYSEDRCHITGTIDSATLPKISIMNVRYRTEFGVREFTFSVNLENNPIEQPKSFRQIKVPEVVLPFLDGYWFVGYNNIHINTNSPYGSRMGQLNGEYFIDDRPLDVVDLPPSGFIDTGDILEYVHHGKPVILKDYKVVDSVSIPVSYRARVDYYYFEDDMVYHARYMAESKEVEINISPVSTPFYATKGQRYNVTGLLSPVSFSDHEESEWIIKCYDKDGQIDYYRTVEFAESGQYTVKVELTGKYNGSDEAVIDVVVNDNDGNDNSYRYEVFTFNKNVIIGYWVIEDIRAAFNVGVDFRDDPDNIVFRDTFGVKEMIKAFEADMKVQDSRSGAVYHKDYVWK